MKILNSYPLSSETTFLCGGKARFYVEVNNLTEFENILKLHNGKYYILGAGSKTLCKDTGYDGLVISTKKLNKIELKNNLLYAECGTLLFDLHEFCLNNELGGLEFSYGIPGSVGGAVVMNAGAFGGEVSEFVEEVVVFENGKRKTLGKSEISFGYRTSSLNGKNIEKVAFRLFHSPSQEIRAKQQEYLKKRSISQPNSTASAGSVFKRSNNVIPAQLIEKLGLKGKKYGGAVISDKHANFIVNSGNATATDIEFLIDLIENKVYKEYNIKLEKEIIILG